MGASTASALATTSNNVDLILAGRNKEGADAARSQWPGLEKAAFAQCDITSPESLAKALDGADLVINCAGPFQKRESCQVLEAAIDAKVPYIDVCDDMAFARRAKTLHEKAKAAGVAAVTTTGIYPGLSNVMAAEMIAVAQAAAADRTDEDGTPKPIPKPTKLSYNYFTAGSGGAGPTILSTSFLLCNEQVTAYKDGEEVTLPPASYRQVVDFGPGIGSREVFLYNLPEVYSAHEVLDIPSVSARFGTSPGVFNTGMQLVASAVPKGMLGSAEGVKPLVALATPFVKLADKFVGEAVAMKVCLEMDDGSAPTGVYVHKELSKAVGIATAAFAQNMLEGGTQPGVWFPEEEGAVAAESRGTLLERGSAGTKKFLMNKALWSLESTPMQIGFGFYWEK